MTDEERAIAERWRAVGVHWQDGMREADFGIVAEAGIQAMKGHRHGEVRLAGAMVWTEARALLPDVSHAPTVGALLEQVRRAWPGVRACETLGPGDGGALHIWERQGPEQGVANVFRAHGGTRAGRLVAALEAAQRREGACDA